MYHETTTKTLARRRKALATFVVALALVAALGWSLLGRMGEASREQGAAALRQSILTAASRCCAVEGFYPESVDYLEQRYGLRVNDEDYAVTYEVFASNVAPSVVVVPR